MNNESFTLKYHGTYLKWLSDEIIIGVLEMLHMQKTNGFHLLLTGLCFKEVKSFVPFPRRDSKRKNTLTMSS